MPAPDGVLTPFGALRVRSCAEHISLTASLAGLAYGPLAGDAYLSGCADFAIASICAFESSSSSVFVTQ